MPDDSGRHRYGRMKKILLVTSAYTGAGHQSISDALEEQFSRMPDVEVKTIEGFDLLGGTGRMLSGLYGVMIRHAPGCYNLAWRLSMKKKHPPEFRMTVRLGRRRFAGVIREFHPDLILSVHSCFNALLTRMEDSLGLEIPVVVLQADVINIHSTWCNPRAALTICPTKEAYEASLLQGMPAEKMKIIGFPVRSRFCEAAREKDPQEYTGSRPLRCLLIGGGEGTGSLRAYAESILRNTDAELTIVCGRNSGLQRQLQKTLVPQYGGRAEVLGFVTAMEQELLRHDLLVTRASPNMMYEAVVMTVPLITIGAMPEQERDNPRLMEKYNLGVIGKTPEEIPQIIRSLQRDDASRFREIRAAQRSLRRFGHAREIAACVAGMIHEERPENNPR